MSKTLYRDITEKPSFDIKNRTVSGSFASPTPCDRYDYETWSLFQEILDMNSKSWDLSRVTSRVCPFLNQHNPSDPLGLITSATFNNQKGYFEAKITRNFAGDEFFANVEDGLATAISFGYQVLEYKTIADAKYEGEGRNRVLVQPEQRLATSVVLLEISAVSIPADITVGVGVRSLNTNTNNQKRKTNMSESTLTEVRRYLELEKRAQVLVDDFKISPEERDFLFEGEINFGNVEFTLNHWEKNLTPNRELELRATGWELPPAVKQEIDEGVGKQYREAWKIRPKLGNQAKKNVHYL